MRHTLNRALLLAVLSLFLTFGTNATTMGGSITYDLQNFAALQNGCTLSGTITTDGTIGVLSSADVVAWSFSVTGPQAYTLTSQDPNTVVSTLSGVIATATSLIIPVPAQGVQSDGIFLISNGTNFGGSPGLRYYRQGDTIPGESPYDQYDMTVPSPIPLIPIYAWLDTALRPPGLNLGSVGISAQGGGSPWTIGTLAAPEPSSLTLGLLGVACLAVARWTRRILGEMRDAAARAARPSLTHRPLSRA